MSADGTGLSLGHNGPDVRVLQVKLAQLGAAIPAAERASATFGDATQQAVANVQAANRLEPTGVLDVATANAIAAALVVVPYAVGGTVVSGDHAGVGGLLVAVVDKNVPDPKAVAAGGAGASGDVVLARAVTDDRGRWSASFDSTALTARHKLHPDLQVLVATRAGQLAASAVRYNASPSETIDVQLPAGAGVLPSEHETLTSGLAAQYAGRLADLQENGQRSDITYLANKTGWDARAVAMAALADQLSAQQPPAAPGAAQQQAVHPAFYYALLRAGLPADPPALFSTDATTVERVWKQALERGVVPAELAQQLPAALDGFQKLSAAHALDSRALGGASTLAQMLSVSLGENAQAHQQFAGLYARFRNDLPTFWDNVTKTFGDKTAQRLQLDGRLARLTLNNADLVGKLHQAAPLNAALDLAQSGYYRADAWTKLIGESVPPQIPGTTPAEKKANYAAVLAAQVRISFPTAVVAERVKSGELPLGVAPDLRDAVHAVLTKYQDTFAIGARPFEQFAAQNGLGDAVAAPVRQQIERLQRVYQITPDDASMSGLLQSNIDSAYQIAQYGPDEFVRGFGAALGGDAQARSVYRKAMQVHNAVLNVAMSYVASRNLPALGNGGTAIVAPSAGPPAAAAGAAPAAAGAAPAAAGAAPANGAVIAYPTLESLFGAMDYCACEDCRSILSPAAYLVDLLLFVDRRHNELANPQTVLLGRRPDIAQLPLTCANTNTPVPYIDLVNEILEYFVTHSLSLTDYAGHDTGSAVPAELLASPQYVTGTAYDALQTAHFPPPLPFHRPLETLRRDFSTFGVPLAEAMEALRKDDAVERGTPASYGWRDVLLERIGLSRQEYQLLSDRTLTLQDLSGFDPATPPATVLASLAGVKRFAHALGLTFDDVTAVLHTRFVNPNVALLPKLLKLGVPFSTLKALENGTITDAAFDALLPPGLDASQYGGDVKAWVKNAGNYAKIMKLITIANPADETNLCNYDALEFRYAEPDNAHNALTAIEYYKLIRFVRLWKKLGWTVSQVDAAFTALYPPANLPTNGVLATDLQNLETGFAAFLPRLGVLDQIVARLGLRVDRDLPSLLACFGAIGTDGDDALYRTMFLRPALLAHDAVFADDGFGNVLTDATKKLLDHAETLRGAFKLTADEFSTIVADRGFDASTVLTLANITAIYRRGWLARQLRLSVREFTALVRLSNWHPFASIDPPNPDMLALIGLVSALRASGLKPAQAIYLLWNLDLSGKSAPDDALVTGFAHTLRGDFAAVESDFALVADPGGEIAHARMALVYGAAAADFFFGIVNGTMTAGVPYANPAPALDPAILAAGPGIGYDDFRKQLTYGGMLTTATRDALLAVPGVSPAFAAAVNALYAAAQAATGPFFDRYPELLAIATSADPPATKRANLLAQVLPALKRLRKQQQALSAVSAATGTDPAFAPALLTDRKVLHAVTDANAPALDDLTAIESPGPSVQFFWRDTATAPADRSDDTAPLLDYAPGANPLPANPTAGHAISAIWSGYLEVPQTGLYNVAVDADAGATVSLSAGGVAVPMALGPNGTTWSNQSAVALTAGTLYAFALTVAKTTNTMRVRWETAGSGRQVIPARYLYSATLVEHLRRTFLRFLKGTSLAAGLSLTANELAKLATDPDLAVTAQSWLSVLQRTGTPPAATAQALRDVLIALLDYARLKAALSPGDERFSAVLQNPAATLPDGSSQLVALTGWNADSLAALLARFGKVLADLAHVETFRRVADAYAVVTAFGISAAALAAATINDPTGPTVDALQSALRARYAEPDWLNVIKPINDQLRELQRDALVAYILQRLPPATGIDTPDKLYEYFLVDTQMEACMETSRIRLALSSVQLFVERCLMNLEPQVAASSILAGQWEWMKRYRVWQANREVFLWPENWLEPELRDDQSPFFKGAMSQLLQSDITEDTAAVALLDYLSKLEEVAKLEPCGIYYVEGEPGVTSDVAHVVARTSGAHRKHFYRKRRGAAWTPWEEIKLEIEDTPVVPVVWNDRLLLFWLKVLKTTPIDPNQLPTTATTGTKKMTEVTLGDVKSDAKSGATGNLRVSYSAVLCYSECYNGKWQPVHTSDPNAPADLGSYDVAGQYAFDRSQLQLGGYAAGDTLVVTVRGSAYAQFVVYNTHSAPLASDAATIPDTRAYRYVDPAGTNLKIWYAKVAYNDQGWNWDETYLERDVLADPLPFRAVVPFQTLRNVWDAPFFVHDGRYAFYVRTSEAIVQIPQWSGYGVVYSVPQTSVDIPPLVLQAVPNFNPVPDPIGPVASGVNLAVVDPSPVEQYVSSSTTIRTALPTTAAFAFNGVQIGAGGSLPLGNQFAGKQLT